MAAPSYVPLAKTNNPRVYESPPRRPEPWLADRPGDLPGAQPHADQLGVQGPDQGYMLLLARSFEGRLVLVEGEFEADVLLGCVGVALKRASLFGRGPVIHDMTAALAVWGYLGAAPAPLVELRRDLFAEVALAHHYTERRHIVDLVPDEVLRLGHDEIASRAAADWRAVLDLDGA